MSTSDIIGLANVGAQVLVAMVAIVAIVASLRANKKQIKASEAQISRQIEENRRLTADERQHQSRPIIVPKKEISHNTITTFSLETGKASENIYTSDHLINWSWNHDIRINLHNMGNGPAFNLHCVLYGPEPPCHSQFVSWDNGPIEEKSSADIELAHSSELRLFQKDSVDGEHPLYDMSIDSPSNPANYRIACLTITYHDLFGKRYVSIFNYTRQHRWVHLITKELPEKSPLDLKELNEQKKQGSKLKASTA